MAFRFEQVIDVGQPEFFEDGVRHELRMTVRTDLEFKDVSATGGVSMTLDLYSHLFPVKRERTRASSTTRSRSIRTGIFARCLPGVE